MSWLVCVSSIAIIATSGDVHSSVGQDPKATSDVGDDLDHIGAILQEGVTTSHTVEPRLAYMKRIPCFIGFHNVIHGDTLFGDLCDWLHTPMKQLEPNLTDTIARLASDIDEEKRGGFEKLHRRLFLEYQEMMKLRIHGFGPRNGTYKRAGASLAATAKELQSWSAVELATSVQGLSRAPLVMTKVRAVGAQLEAYRLLHLDEVTFQQFESAEPKELALEVASEVRKLLGHYTKTPPSLYTIAVEINPHFSQLVTAIMMLQAYLRGDQNIPVWDDGLSVVRMICKSKSTLPCSNASIQVNTIDKLQWFCNWQGIDSSSVDIHSQFARDVHVKRLLKDLGCDHMENVCVGSSDADRLQLLMQAVLPSFRLQAQKKLAFLLKVLGLHEKETGRFHFAALARLNNPWEDRISNLESSLKQCQSELPILAESSLGSMWFSLVFGAVIIVLCCKCDLDWGVLWARIFRNVIGFAIFWLNLAHMHWTMPL